jgi:uncharacterized alpha-E superfamily protein
MLSRVADNLYWMSRYLERAEHGSRQLAVHLNLVLDQEEEAAALRRHRVLAALHAPTEDDSALSDARLVQTVAFQLENANAIVNCIRFARENARQVREQINMEMWQKLNELYLYLRNVNLVGQSDVGEVDFFEEVIEHIQLFQGVTDATMNHGQGWQFIQLGRNLERVVNTTHLLRVEFDALATHVGGRTLADEPTYLEWLGLLKACAAFEAYSKVYTFDLQPNHIAEFLLLNEEFPRSVDFAVVSVQSALDALAKATDTHKSNRVYRLAGRLRSSLEYADIGEIMDGGLGDYLDDIQKQCFDIHDAMYQIYISYSAEQKIVA